MKKRVLSLLLVLVMVLGMLPGIRLPAFAAEAPEITVLGKVADSSTMHNWKDYYGTSSILPDGGRGISTWKAGGVWTDKSVFASVADLQAADSSAPAVTIGEDSFLIALSALGSTKKVTGLSSAPTDTMLVLDLSQSMDQSNSVRAMVNATNATINALLEMNANNRVGVVLYSGNSNTSYDAQPSSATTILPLDRYTASSGVYLTVTGQGDTTVSVASGTRNSDGRTVTGSKNTVGGTYIQNGLYKAYQAFSAMSDKGVVLSGSQKNTQRTPIIVLMSDGAPTIATTNYSNVGTSNTGDGSNTTNRITFLTQLTAAYVKGMVQAHYNNTPAKFYTLGLNTATSEQATAVLYPSGSGNTLKNYWDNFSDGTSNGSSVWISSGFSVTYNSTAANVGMNYVDSYWSASNSAAMVDAFRQIVNDIEMQSAFSVTLVESGEANLDGYITVEDELGAMMEVKSVKGIWLDDALFTGAEVAKSLESMGSIFAPNAYGDEFVRTIKERIGISDTSVAQQLISRAYQAQQLHYTDSTNYSNFIGWYGDSANSYLGFWQESDGWDGAGAPAGAKYINRSYVYVGQARSTDMMHIVVMVRTDIATGHQTVLFKIPSSLIPLVTYSVDVASNDISTAYKLTVQEANPIRLLYEVGLPDDVNAVNLVQKVEAYSANGGAPVQTDKNGNYVFYANNWDNDHDGVAPIIESLSGSEKSNLTKYVAEAHFIPNVENERFYILEDSLVYDASHNKVTSCPVAGGTYYFARTIVTATGGANGAAHAEIQYEQLSEGILADANNFTQNDEGFWVVKSGTIRQALTRLHLAKNENKTGTLKDSDSLWVDISGNTAADHNIYNFLGNNGKLTVAPATGLSVSKTVTELADGASADERFPITVTFAQAETNLIVTNADGNPTTVPYEISDDQTKVTLNLKDGEKAYITGLTPGNAYTVTEADHEKYTAIVSAPALVAGKITAATVTNTPIKEGGLFITKEVVSDHAVPDAVLAQKYTFTLTLQNSAGAPLANKTFQIKSVAGEQTQQVSTDENGKLTIHFEHGETAHLLGLPEGTVVTVEETNIPSFVSKTEYRSRNASGMDADDDGVVVIQPESNATVVVTNTYTPKSTAGQLDLTLDKTFYVDDPAKVDHALDFYFNVEYWNGSSWSSVVTESLTFVSGNLVSGENDRYISLSIALKDYAASGSAPFTKAGEYQFRIYEVIPTGRVPGLTYDRTIYTLTVKVEDVDGQLTITSIMDRDGNVVADTDSNGVFDYSASFVNEYNTAPVSLDIDKLINDNSNSSNISKAGFHFMAVEYTDDTYTTVKNGGSTLTVTTDSKGNARMTATYKEEGTHYFLLTEALPANVPSGWTYSTESYKVQVDVRYKDGSATDLEAVLTIDGQTADASGVPYGNSAQLTFTNTYDPEDVYFDLNAVPTVLKRMDGRDLIANEFTFAVFENGRIRFNEDGTIANMEDALAVGTNDAAGNVFFQNELHFSAEGKYEFDIVEVKGTLGGVTYDPVVYDFVIEVQNDAETGKLVIASDYFEDSVEEFVTFVNHYTSTPAEAVIGGYKVIDVLNGAKELFAGEFEFALYEGENPASDALPLQIAKNRADGSFLFSAITYSAPGEYVYTVRELEPATAAPGMQYSAQSFKVTVNVTDNGAGALNADVIGAGQNMTFVNTYSSKSVSATINGSKVLDGRPLTDQEFNFIVYSSDATFQTVGATVCNVTNDAQGNISLYFGTFDTVGTYYFVAKEVIPEERAAGIHYDANDYHITVSVTDSGVGQMAASLTVYHTGDPNTVNPPVLFTNRYSPEDGEVVIRGQKTYLGGKTLNTGDFTAELYEDGQLIASAPIQADGTFAFEALRFTAEDMGTHTYTVKELIPADATDNGNGTKTADDIIYDATEYTVTVTVADDEKDGVLEIGWAASKGGKVSDLTFVNTFIPGPVEHTLQAAKQYNKPLQGGDFTFKLEGKIGTQQINQTKKNDENGLIVFDALSFSEEGTYTFTVKEIDKIFGFIGYSVEEYKVEIVVKNTGGVLSIDYVAVNGSKNGTLDFVNTYILDGEDEVTISGTKILTGDRTQVSADEFAFGLYDENGVLIEEVKNDVYGKFTFTTLTFDESHTSIDGKSSFTYTVKEIAGTNTRYTYDTTVYTVVITVEDNDEGGITATYTVNDVTDGTITFTNTYTDPTPVTYTPEATKLYNKTLNGSDFSFMLKGEIAGEEIRMIKSNDADGKVLFDTLSFPEAGVYTFLVGEVDTGLAYVDYCDTTYELVITVADDNGTLQLESAIVTGSTDDEMVFENTYILNDQEEVTVGGTKILTGDRTAAEDGEFHFVLLDSEGNLVEDVTNDANGNFTFTALTFDNTHTTVDGSAQYTYTVHELAGNAIGMTYDAAIYTVVITVEDDDEGGITVTYTVNGAPDGTISFTNIYDAPPEGPQTGDASRPVLWMCMMLFSGAALVLLVIFGKKEKQI